VLLYDKEEQVCSTCRFPSAASSHHEADVDHLLADTARTEGSVEGRQGQRWVGGPSTSCADTQGISYMLIDRIHHALAANAPYTPLREVAVTEHRS
jgi:hypothetical protein